MGLRERKKRNTREAILAAAQELFLEKGYKAASVEMIAEASGVAVGTIYNYFASKAEIMVELNAGETERAIARLQSLNLVDNSVEDILWEVVSSMLFIIGKYPRELIRELMAATIENNRSSLTSGLVSQDARFIGYLSSVIGTLKEAGRLKPEADPDTVAFGVYSLVFGGVLWYAVDESSNIDDTGVQIAGMIGQFCRGILPEGESR